MKAKHLKDLLNQVNEELTVITKDDKDIIGLYLDKDDNTIVLEVE